MAQLSNDVDVLGTSLYGYAIPSRRALTPLA